ncbi:hypothetical protein [Candidatus Phytoplasma melaleucae]|uniref:Uncharacterized protein n=1 Tax=Candidatus Phytoplasma melaleucae TaxID=2982630 RepID=A0ABT9DDP0_9MOLU|nr:hypothetical protein ['Melaleuca sp.' phytoplasma]MDO8168152.1 hypothetical protein ['Melaleuca sp.' phytoplasma]MDV3205461.1 hypothetical protein [Weeping tea tree witches'-broom phytoplasma]
MASIIYLNFFQKSNTSNDEYKQNLTSKEDLDSYDAHLKRIHYIIQEMKAEMSQNQELTSILRDELQNKLQNKLQDELQDECKEQCEDTEKEPMELKKRVGLSKILSKINFLTKNKKNNDELIKQEDVIATDEENIQDIGQNNKPNNF